MEKVTETVKVDYSSFYLEAVKNIKQAHDALIKGKFQEAYNHCIDAQVEMKLMGGAVKSWIEVKE
jgi:hypothetical protein